MTVRNEFKRFFSQTVGMSSRLKRLIGFGPAPETIATRPTRGPVSHVIIIDGTMSRLDEGFETHAGTTFRLLSEMSKKAPISLKYEQGIQWQGLRRVVDVMAGVGINRQIRRAYGFIASRYRPGDRIYLIGYSRGAYAVRSLAGLIDQIGLLRTDQATERNVRQAYRHYRMNPTTATAQSFRACFCHEDAPIEMVGVWDTVRALGFRAPFLWRFSPVEHEFNTANLGRSVKRGFHALALNETRRVFEPVLWQSDPGGCEHIEQVWFRGTHGDVGGHLLGCERARPLANIPLVWMLERAALCGLPLPHDWPARFETDTTAPSVGSWRGLAKLFLQRRKRQVGQDSSERIHPSAVQPPRRRRISKLRPQRP